jgi:hypothetical protein
MLAAALVFGAGCGGDTPTAPPAPPSESPLSPALVRMPPALPGLPALGLVKCTPKPTAFGKARIGPEGGTIRAGKHELRVPAGALRRPVAITMRAPSDTINAVVFEPDGLTFRKGHAPRLSLDYSNCSGANHVRKHIVYLDDLLNVMEIMSSIDDPRKTTVTARIKHFSRYAVHY